MKTNTETSKQAKKEEEKQKVKEEEKKEATSSDKKMPLMFMDEVNKTLDKESLALFKEALMKYKTGQTTEIDTLTGEVSSTSILIVL